MAAYASASASASASAALSPLSSPHLSLPLIPKSKPLSCYFLNSSSPPLTSSLTLSLSLSLPQFKISPHPINQTLIIPLKKPRNLRASAAAEDTPISTETAEQIVSATSADDAVSNIISILSFIAFLGLLIVTVGVIYIGVTDFLQKREQEKFEKEEAAKKKKKVGKKVMARARTGPRGFGQKIDEEDDGDDI